MPAPTPTPAPAPAPTAPPLYQDGSLIVSNPYGMYPLGPMTPGQAIFPRVGPTYHVYFGLNDNSLWLYDNNHNRVDLATADQVGAIAQAAGASFVRLALGWPTIEWADVPADQWNFSVADDMYRGLIAHGVRPLWNITMTPRFAVADADAGSCQGIYCEAEPDMAHPEYMRRFGAELARRYPLAAGFELRNETNLPCENGPYTVSPAKIAASIKAFSTGVRSTRPNMRILGGALSGCAGMPRPLADYTHQLVTTYGIAPYVSAISFHPYDETARALYFDQMIDTLRAQLDADGHPEVRIVASEVGVRTDTFALQSERSARLRDQFNRVNGDTRIDAFVAFNTIETGNHYGWLRQKDSMGRFQARRPYCDFREMLQVSYALPSFVRNCLPRSIEDATAP